MAYREFKRAVFVLTNHERRGRRHLKKSRLLNRSAQSKARHLAKTGVLEHGTWWTRFARTIRKPWGENIADGQHTPTAVVSAWMNSPEHRANIMNIEYRLLGVGFARSQDGTEWWVQHFGG